MVLDDTGSVEGGSGWYLVVLGHYRVVLVETLWYWVSIGRGILLVCAFALIFALFALFALLPLFQKGKRAKGQSAKGQKGQKEQKGQKRQKGKMAKGQIKRANHFEKI